MKHEKEYYLEQFNAPVLPDINLEDQGEDWLKCCADDSICLDWIEATGIYDNFESAWEKYNGDFMLISKAKWNPEKKEGTMYIFICTKKKDDSGIMAFVVPNYWKYADETNQIIVSFSQKIKGRIVNTTGIQEFTNE
tara:strand:- start:82 stop:492 length:411 start_codon:yes stop_codon:yes gene_type:complete